MSRSEPIDPEGDLVTHYLRQIAKTPLLTADEEVDLAKRVEAGVFAAHLHQRNPSPELRELAEDGQRAKDHMVRANLRLVVSVAKKHGRRATSG